MRKGMETTYHSAGHVVHAQEMLAVITTAITPESVPQTDQALKWSLGRPRRCQSLPNRGRASSWLNWIVLNHFRTCFLHLRLFLDKGETAQSNRKKSRSLLRMPGSQLCPQHTLRPLPCPALSFPICIMKEWTSKLFHLFLPFCHLRIARCSSRFRLIWHQNKSPKKYTGCQAGFDNLKNSVFYWWCPPASFCSPENLH